MLLNLRLRQLGLRPVNIGDEGNWFSPSSFFPALIGQAGVQYLSNNPERLKAILRIHVMNL